MRSVLPFTLRQGIFLFLITSSALTACGAPATEAPGRASTDAGAPEPEATERSAVAAVPRDPGLEIDNPAPMGELITTDEWEFEVLEVLGGEEAQAMLDEASAFNEPPQDPAMEWVAVRIRAKNVGTEVEPRRVDVSFFKSADSSGKLYDRPKVTEVSRLEPVLEGELLPGEEVEGWIVLFSPKGETGLVLLIQPRLNGFSTGPQHLRYVSLGG